MINFLLLKQAQQGEQDEQAVQGGEPQSVAAVAQAMRVLYQAFVDKVSDALSKPAPIPEETLKEWLKDIGDKREGIIGVIGSKLAAVSRIVFCNNF